MVLFKMFYFTFELYLQYRNTILVILLLKMYLVIHVDYLCVHPPAWTRFRREFQSMHVSYS